MRRRSGVPTQLTGIGEPLLDGDAVDVDLDSDENSNCLQRTRAIEHPDSAGDNMNLAAFRAGVQARMVESTERPFVCDGSPLSARVFIVGFNPATTLPVSFWSFWSDEKGFDRSSFADAYGAVRPTKSGNRPRIEAIASAFLPGACIETTIHCRPSASADELSKLSGGQASSTSCWRPSSQPPSSSTARPPSITSSHLGLRSGIFRTTSRRRSIFRGARSW